MRKKCVVCFKKKLETKSAENPALKALTMEQLYVIKKSVEDLSPPGKLPRGSLPLL